MLRRKKYFVLYPEYFNRSLTRKQGRKLPKIKAVDNCTLSKIVYACKHLELDFEVEKDKKYSKTWWASEGRVIINPEGITSKIELIRRVANISRKLKKVEKTPNKKKKSTSKK